MAQGSLYSTKCPLFDRTYRGGGVMFPYFPMALGAAASNLAYIDLDGSASTIQSRVRVPFTCMLVTCEAFGVSDGAGAPNGLASVKAVIGVNYGTAGLASIDAGTEIATITCSMAGVGLRSAGSTTETIITPAQELIVHLKTAATGTASADVDGGAAPVLWFAQLNAP